MILFINHSQARCGVYQFGLHIGNALEQYANKYKWKYIETNGDNYNQIIEQYNPEAVIYNYYSLTMPWLGDHILLNAPYKTIGIIHETGQWSIYGSFQHFIVPDPTFEPNESRARDEWHLFHKTGRLIPKHYHQNFVYPPDQLTIGSFGFGFDNKGYRKVIDLVQQEFDEAKIRLHIPYANFGDDGGAQARERESECRAAIHKPGIQLEVTHDFLDMQQLLDWLYQNTINVFLYEQMWGRGIASTTDYALAVKRPIAISDCDMFRHLQPDKPIRIEETSLRSIIDNGFAPLEKYYIEWHPITLVKRYEEIIESICS